MGPVGTKTSPVMFGSVQAPERGPCGSPIINPLNWACSLSLLSGHSFLPVSSFLHDRLYFNASDSLLHSCLPSPPLPQPRPPPCSLSSCLSLFALPLLLALLISICLLLLFMSSSFPFQLCRYRSASLSLSPPVPFNWTSLGHLKGLSSDNTSPTRENTGPTREMEPTSF